VVLGVLMRIQMLTPGMRLMDARGYNTMFTLHGIIMIFLVVIPGIPTIFGNFALPMLIGANDMAFPGSTSSPGTSSSAGAVLAAVSVFTNGGAPDTGWTFYVPFSLKTSVNVPLATFAVFVLGMSSILTGINIVTTVHQLRAPGMTFFKMPLSVWGLYSTAWVQILATPIIGITMLLIVVERLFGIGVFDPTKGGDPLLYQHLFWIYSHPAVYIMILPAMGVISDIFPVFSRKNIFGYKMIAFSSLAIASVGSLVWGHHMYVSGQSDTADIVFSLLTFLVAVPSAIKVFNWIATMYKGSIRLDAPFLFALTFVFLFSIGGLTGLLPRRPRLGRPAPRHLLRRGPLPLHHLRRLRLRPLRGPPLLVPQDDGQDVREDRRGSRLARHLRRLQRLLFPLPHHGLDGHAAAVLFLPAQVRRAPILSSIGSYVMVAGIAIILGNLLLPRARRGEIAPANPWGGPPSNGPCPRRRPYENWEEPPTVTKGPYDYTGHGG
jgi:cytochrome c oxidase subunit 1